MGVRFQRRIKIAPGLTLVASKRGVGLSGGVTGARVSVTPSGMHAHGGLPGTGLAYRSKLNAKGSRGTATRGRTDASGGPGVNVDVAIAEDGSIELRRADGVPLTQQDERRIRSEMEGPIRDELTRFCERNNAGLVALGEVHHDTPAPRESPEFEARVFLVDGPERQVKVGGLWEALWPPARRRLATENDALALEYEVAMEEWNAARAAFAQEEANRERRETVEVWSSLDAMAMTLETHLGGIPWPKETEVEFDLGDNSKTIAINLHLTAEDEMPGEDWQVQATRLKVTRKTLPAIRRREVYRDYIHGVAVRVLGEVYARLPTIEIALVNGVVKGVDPATGRAQDITLYSVMASRAAWSAIDFDRLREIDPAETLALFKLRRQMSKTGILKPVTPFSLECLEAEGGRGWRPAGIGWTSSLLGREAGLDEAY